MLKMWDRISGEELPYKDMITVFPLTNMSGYNMYFKLFYLNYLLFYELFFLYSF